MRPDFTELSANTERTTDPAQKPFFKRLGGHLHVWRLWVRAGHFVAPDSLKTATCLSTRLFSGVHGFLQIGGYFMLIRAINAEIVRRRYKPLINNIKNENTVT